MDPAAALSVATAVASVGAILFAALRHPREEATAAFELMRGLNDELQEALDRCRHDREWCRGERHRLTQELDAARAHGARCEQLLTTLGQEVPRDERDS